MTRNRSAYRVVRCWRAARLLVACLLIGAGARTSFAQTSRENTLSSAKTAFQFRTLDVFVHTGRDPLAAYQVEITYDRKLARIVGLEGGQPPAYTNAPYFDRAGFSAGRIIVAAFTADKDAVPKGEFRIARLHVAVKPGADPAFKISLTTAAKPGGTRIKPRVELRKGPNADIPGKGDQE